MTCNQCGAEAPAQAAFCSQCGAPLASKGDASGSRPVSAARLQASGGQTPHDAPEEELWSGAYSGKAMIGPFIGVALLTVLAFVVAKMLGASGIAWGIIAIVALLSFGYLGLLLLYRQMSVRYRLTTHRLVLDKGIISRSEDRILLVDVDDISVRQGLIERTLNLATIILNTSDQTSPILVMRGIENGRHVGEVIDESRRTERSRRGVYMMNA